MCKCSWINYFWAFMPCYFCFLSLYFCVSLFATIGWFLFVYGGFVTVSFVFFLMFVIADISFISTCYSVFLCFHLTWTWEFLQLCFCYFLDEAVYVNLPPVNWKKWPRGFCTHLSLAGVHAWRQLIGVLVHKEVWFQIHSGATSREAHGAVGLVQWYGKLGSRGTVRTDGSGGSIASVDFVEWHETAGRIWSWRTTLNPPIEVGVAQILKTFKQIFECLEKSCSQGCSHISAEFVS